MICRFKSNKKNDLNLIKKLLIKIGNIAWDFEINWNKYKHITQRKKKTFFKVLSEIIKHFYHTFNISYRMKK